MNNEAKMESERRELERQQVERKEREVERLALERAAPAIAEQERPASADKAIEEREHGGNPVAKRIAISSEEKYPTQQPSRAHEET